ncbi:peptidoglycan recognition protein family protein [Ureibacillus sinduriensis]|uniref:N-acetylmuramoyl-L-alanine amidase n=1 Tax=Ureibacillus sinduriensis BLB-1 = JCM 15800 TaxID=1384057 RepID=A0A0A3HWS2_9BACL|nr:peptidoglycan recognition family protein [Ureibacillus sinduriensis]KGR74783.1 N-acetylmuramoyl-L-alanine amidase [Ureibacillus sinduriensis BLB-1 = JCM 15800]
MKIIQRNFQFIEPLLPLESIQSIIVHHTSREHMSAEECHEFHQKERGWSGIGYNYFIEKNGSIIEGRGQHVGAHAYGYNRTSIGICMTGDFDKEIPTTEQWSSLFWLSSFMLKLYHLQPDRVLGHRELEGVQKSCPGRLIEMDEVRKQLMEYMQ